MQVLSLQDVKKNNRLVPTMVRLPQSIRDKAKEVADDKSVNVTDIYRTAILSFLSNVSTDSRDIDYGEG